MARPVLQIIIGSTRPTRVGGKVGRWFYQATVEHGGFDVEIVDLAEVDLPIFNEPKHPRFGEYEYQHTKDWSATISRADAYVFVIPEYNHGVNAATKNAIDYLHKEWAYKPVGFVSYGGVAAGTRAMQMVKQSMVALRMTPVFEAVNIPFVHQFLTDDGVFVPNEVLESAVKPMLDEIARVDEALRPLRTGRP
jgi:NAD(P)H-dependent FMN reductase